MSNRGNKKKILVLVLLLVAAVGIAGYKAYSYYWAKGNIEEYEHPVITLKRDFYPRVNGSYLSNGGSIDLTCPTSQVGETTVTCTGSLEISNDSTETVNFEVIESSASSSNEKVTIVGQPQFSWESSTSVSAGEYNTLNVSVVVTNGIGSEPEEVSDPVASDSSTVSVSFKLKATQAH